MRPAISGQVVAYIALVGLSLVGVGQLARSAVREDLRAPVVRIDDRYREVLALVPRDAVLGYVSDLPRDLGDGDYRFYERYYQAQYAFAPRLLIDSPRHDLVVADLSDPASVHVLCARHGLRVTHASPSGHVVLLMRVDAAR